MSDVEGNETNNLSSEDEPEHEGGFQELKSIVQDVIDFLHRLFPPSAATAPDMTPPGTPRYMQTDEPEAEGDPKPGAPVAVSGPSQGIVSNQPAAMAAAADPAAPAADPAAPAAGA